jgi:hypothetical protein
MPPDVADEERDTMKKLIVAGVTLSALAASALALTSRPAPAAESQVGLDQLGAEVDARLHADLTRLAQAAAQNNAATRQGRAVKVASR